jgi:hypothetical protein
VQRRPIDFSIRVYRQGEPPITQVLEQPARAKSPLFLPYFLSFFSFSWRGKSFIIFLTLTRVPCCTALRHLFLWLFPHLFAARSDKRASYQGDYCINVCRSHRFLIYLIIAGAARTHLEFEYFFGLKDLFFFKATRHQGSNEKQKRNSTSSVESSQVAEQLSDVERLEASFNM